MNRFGVALAEKIDLGATRILGTECHDAKLLSGVAHGLRDDLQDLSSALVQLVLSMQWTGSAEQTDSLFVQRIPVKRAIGRIDVGTNRST